MAEHWNKLDPGFLEPPWLLVGLLAMISVGLLELGALRRRRQAVRMFAASHLVTALTGSVSPAKRLLKAALMIAAFGLLFFALARPHLLDDWRDESRSGLDILLAVDCSKSMLTEDVKRNRLERAKLAIADFAEQLPENRLGLIAFAGDAFLQCPLTLDHEAFQTAVHELDTDTIPRPGTDIATAIDTAVDAVRSQPANMKFLILVTDGEDLEGRALDAARNAAQAGLKIYTVGVGTPNGGTIPLRDDFGSIEYLRDTDGNVVESKLDETTLREIARITGGAYVPLGQQGGGLDEIYQHYIAPLPKQNHKERKERIPIERFEWPLAAAILFLMWEFLVNERAAAPALPAPPLAALRPHRKASRKALAAAPLIIAATLAIGAAGGLRASDVDAAERDYKSGDYDDALQNYREAAQDQPQRNDLQYNRGDAAYKAGDYSEAEDAFRHALDTPDLDLQERAYYNLGNAQFQHGQQLVQVDTKKTIHLWEQALHSYDSALKLKTSNDAIHNYEVVKRKLEELKQQQQQQQNKRGSSSQDDQDQSGQGSGGDQDQPQPDGNNSQNGGQGSQQQEPSSGGQNKPNNGKSSPDKNPVRAYSGMRSQDQQDPGIKSREDAENLLDSLKDDERHVTARTLNMQNEPPPPPPSGKDW